MIQLPLHATLTVLLFPTFFIIFVISSRTQEYLDTLLERLNGEAPNPPNLQHIPYFLAICHIEKLSRTGERVAECFAVTGVLAPFLRCFAIVQAGTTEQNLVNKIAEQIGIETPLLLLLGIVTLFILDREARTLRRKFPVPRP